MDTANSDETVGIPEEGWNKDSEDVTEEELNNQVVGVAVEGFCLTRFACTPAILRSMRYETSDTWGSYQPDDIEHSGDTTRSIPIEHKAKNTQDTSTDSQHDDDEHGHEFEFKRHVSFDDNLERVLEIPGRDKPVGDDIAEEVVSDEDHSPITETDSKTKPSSRKSNKQTAHKHKTQSSPKRKVSVQVAGTDPLSSEVKRPNSGTTQRLRNKTDTPQPNNSKSRLISRVTLLDKKVKSESSRRPVTPSGSRHVTSHQNDDDMVELEDVSLAVFEPDTYSVSSQGEQLNSKRHAWQVANGTLPPEANTPNISPMWGGERSRYHVNITA